MSRLRRLPLALMAPFVAAVEVLAAPSCGSAAAPGSATDGSRWTDADPARVDARTGFDAGVCNGHSELCSRLYNHVTFPGTHDSYSTTSEGFAAPDQTYPVARQLADGIRVLHFEVHAYADSIYACHSLCLLGSRLFADEMKAVASFVASRPLEVVTLLLERSDANITADDIGDAMKASGLEPYMHVQQVGARWPTLGEMLGRGQRLVALLDNPTGSSYAWLLPRWQLTWETPWDNTTPGDFASCTANRGIMGDGVYVVDTYMEDLPIETAAHAALVNYDPFLIDRLLYCKRATSTLPNFAMVNFYEVSDLFSVVDVLNGFSATPNDNLDAFPPPSWPSDGTVVDAMGP